MIASATSCSGKRVPAQKVGRGRSRVEPAARDRGATEDLVAQTEVQNGPMLVVAQGFAARQVQRGTCAASPRVTTGTVTASMFRDTQRRGNFLAPRLWAHERSACSFPDWNSFLLSVEGLGATRRQVDDQPSLAEECGHRVFHQSTPARSGGPELQVWASVGSAHSASRHQQQVYGGRFGDAVHAELECSLQRVKLGPSRVEAQTGSGTAGCSRQVQNDGDG